MKFVRNFKNPSSNSRALWDQLDLSAFEAPILKNHCYDIFELCRSITHDVGYQAVYATIPWQSCDQQLRSFDKKVKFCTETGSPRMEDLIGPSPKMSRKTARIFMIPELQIDIYYHSWNIHRTIIRKDSKTRTELVSHWVKLVFKNHRCVNLFIHLFILENNPLFRNVSIDCRIGALVFKYHLLD